MRLISFIFILAISSAAFAKTICVCDVMKDDDAVEQTALKLGCKALQTFAACDESVTDVDETPQSLMSVLKSHEPKPGDTVKITYIGHWGDTNETIGHIDSFVVPIAKRFSVNVVYRNTGCHSMEDPAAMESHLLALKPKLRSSITVAGIQGISIGAVSIFYSNGLDLSGYASTEWKYPRYTACEDIDGVRCSTEFQIGSTGVCYDRPTRSLRYVSCNLMESLIGYQTARWTFGPPNKRDSSAAIMKYKRTKMNPPAITKD